MWDVQGDYVDPGLKHSFFFPGGPVSWARARVGNGQFYTVKHVAEYKRELRMRYLEQAHKKNINVAAPLSEDPLQVTLAFVLKAPQTLKLAPDAFQECPKRPDLDNFTKLILDTFQGFLWEDDSQIASLHASKFYAGDISKVGVYLNVESFEPGTEAYGEWMRLLRP